MIVKVNLQKSGMGIEEATITRWFKSVGDKVKQGELLAEVETAKAVQEVLAPVGGTVKDILVPEGQPARVRTAIATIEWTGE